MKTYRRFIAMLLVSIVFLACVPAYAITSEEKENNYKAAVLELETYLESAGNSSAELAGIRAVFDALGGYEQSRFLSYYTSVLMKIADEEYDYELYMFLDMLERNQSFNAYLKETLKGSSIGSVEELKAYAHGREYEHVGANSEAIASYGDCLNYFDASARYFSLQQDKDQSVYDEATAMLSRGDLAGAYFKFSESLRYEDSKERRESIVSLLGYTPSSPTDNLEAVTGLKAAEIKETEITISWQKSRRASNYQVYYKQHNSNNWTSAGIVSETRKRIASLKAGTAYDFRVIAVSGQVKKEVLLTNVKTASVTPTPKPTPTPTPTPTPLPKPLSIKKITYIGNRSAEIEWEGGANMPFVYVYHYFNAEHNQGIENCIQRCPGWKTGDRNFGQPARSNPGVISDLIPGEKYWIKLTDGYQGKAVWKEFTVPVGEKPTVNISMKEVNFYRLSNDKFVVASGVTAKRIEKCCQNSPTYEENSNLWLTPTYIVKGLSSPQTLNFVYAIVLPNGDILSNGGMDVTVENGSWWYQNGFWWESIYDAYGCIPSGKYTFKFIVGDYVVGTKKIDLK